MESNEVSTLSSEQLTALSLAFADIMAIPAVDARVAAKRGWSIDTVGNCQAHLVQWNELLATHVKCVFELDERDETPSEPYDLKTHLGLTDGRLNLAQIPVELLAQAPNIIVGHECGHDLERKLRAQSDGTLGAPSDGDAPITSGFHDPRKRHSFPPFGTTKHHESDIRAVFEKEYRPWDGGATRNHLQDVDDNARQIYADSVPVKELIQRTYEDKATEGISVEAILIEWTQFLRYQGQCLSSIGRKGPNTLRLDCVPGLVRLKATAEALQKITRAWVEDQERALSIQRDLQAASRAFTNLLEPHDTFPATALLGITASVQASGLSSHGETVFAAAVLMRAYKEHFLNCMSQKEFFEGEDLRPHMEKLESPAEYLRRREAQTLGDIGHLSAVLPLLQLLDREAEQVPPDDLEENMVLLSAAEAVLDVVNANKGSQNLQDFTIEVGARLEKHPAAIVRKVAAQALGAIGDTRGFSALQARMTLDSEDVEVRQACVIATVDVIAVSDPEKALELVDSLLENTQPYGSPYQEQLALRLSELGPKAPDIAFRTVERKTANPIDALSFLEPVLTLAKTFPERTAQTISHLARLGQGTGFFFLQEIGMVRPDIALPILIDIASSESPDLPSGYTWMVLRDIGLKHPEEALEHLIPVLRTASEPLIRAFAPALGAIGAEHLEAFTAFVTEHIDDGEAPRRMLMMAVGFLGEERPAEAIQILTKELGKPVKGKNQVDVILEMMPIGYAFMSIARKHADEVYGTIEELAQSDSFSQQVCALTAVLGLQSARKELADRILDKLRSRLPGADHFMEMMKHHSESEGPTTPGS